MGTLIQIAADGKTTTSPLSACKSGQCRTLPVTVAQGVTTRLRLVASGFRNAPSARKIEATVGGIRVPVVSYAASDYPGTDEVTIEIPPGMPALGETDLSAASMATSQTPCASDWQGASRSPETAA
jgi:hypothetical protein